MWEVENPGRRRVNGKPGGSPAPPPPPEAARPLRLLCPNGNWARQWPDACTARHSSGSHGAQRRVRPRPVPVPCEWSQTSMAAGPRHPAPSAAPWSPSSRRAARPGPHRTTAPTHPQDQLLGGRGHEDAVTPRGAAGVHVLLALAGVLAVRVAGETGHGRQHRLAPALLRPRSTSQGRVPSRSRWDGPCYPGKDDTCRSF